MRDVARDPALDKNRAERPRRQAIIFSLRWFRGTSLPTRPSGFSEGKDCAGVFDSSVMHDNVAPAHRYRRVCELYPRAVACLAIAETSVKFRF